VQKEMVDRVDYSKNKGDIYGLVEFVGVQQPDFRL